MVNNMIVSRYAEAPQNFQANNRAIHGGPLYAGEEVLALIRDVEGQPIIPWTRKCIEDIQNLVLSELDLNELIQIAVTTGTFRGSEWCQRQAAGPWAACDAYSLVRREWMARAYKEMDIDYYIKFAIAKTGKVVLVASCHLHEDRR